MGDYVSLKNLKVELRRDDDGDDSPEEENGCFALCFWVYMNKCASFPSDILVQKQPDVTSTVPFLRLDEKKKIKLFPFLFLHEEAPDPESSVLWTGIPCASTDIEFPLKRWFHVGCEVSSSAIAISFLYLSKYSIFCFLYFSGCY